MPFKNVEIKAKISNSDKIRSVLKGLNADFKGLDHQIDTYFRVPDGRLKLREGNIENNLIFYHRNNEKGPKESNYHLYKTEPDSPLKAILVSCLGIWKVVDKYREIYFIENVKFHIDRVEGLGDFFEIEAIDRTGSTSSESLEEQCRHYLELCGVGVDELMEGSYSDLIGA